MKCLIICMLLFALENEAESGKDQDETIPEGSKKHWEISDLCGSWGIVKHNIQINKPHRMDKPDFRRINLKYNKTGVRIVAVYDGVRLPAEYEQEHERFSLVKRVNDTWIVKDLGSPLYNRNGLEAELERQLMDLLFKPDSVTLHSNGQLEVVRNSSTITFNKTMKFKDDWCSSTNYGIQIVKQKTEI